MLLRELVGGDPEYAYRLIFRDDPTGFGHRVVDGDRVLEHVLTRTVDFEQAVAETIAAGFTETERSLTRRVLVTDSAFWILSLDRDTLRVQFGGLRVNWDASSGQTREKAFRHRDRAVAAYHKAIAEKLAEGYREQDARPVSIAALPNAPKTPGKKKSR